MTLLTGRPTRAALKKLTIDLALGDNCSTIMNQDPCNECRRILPKRESLCSAKLRLGLCAIDLMVKEPGFIMVTWSGISIPVNDPGNYDENWV